MKDKILDRKILIWLLFTAFLGVLGFRLAQLTIVQGEEFSNIALGTRLKKVNLVAKRGEIYDRNGTLIAGNLTSYSVQFLYDQAFSKKQEKMAIELFKLLENDGEITIKIPIDYIDGKFVYETDIKKDKWLLENGFPANASAHDVFDAIRTMEEIPQDVDKYSAQNILLVKGIYMPIRVRDMIFTYDFERKNFLKTYGLDEGISAADAIETMRNKIKLNTDYTDKEAYYILKLRHAIAQKGYLKYEPIKIAQNISKETAILIQEQSMKFPNVSIDIEPVRHYPQSNLASHILGYLGKISTAKELEKYNKESGYQKSDIVGKIGIEGTYEPYLKGRNGHKWIEVNASGRFIRNVGNTMNDERFMDIESKAGSKLQLTLDMNLQSAVRDYLERTLIAISTGGTYESKFGNTVYKDAYKNAKTGAVLVVDVRSGEILSMVSYPDYDINLFARGITYEDYAKLQPENARNPLAPRPLFNIAAHTAVQPGSTFKLVTAFAALDAGLNPYAKYRDAGYIETKDGKTFGCWLWNMYRGAHGPLNLMQAIEVSCNYYFYSVSNGYDYAKKAKLPFDVGADKLIDAAKRFGLDEASGIEIGETVRGVPNQEQKKRAILYSLRHKLKSSASEYFPRSIYSDEDLLSEYVERIIKLGNENPQISRNALITFLKNECDVETHQQALKLANMIKYSFFNQMKWYEGDTFNLAIGQGRHSYTPVQMAKYISAVANGGYLYDLTLVKSIADEPVDRKPYKMIDPKGHMKYLREGMNRVASGPKGSVKSYFKDFPIEVGAKTGTAEKEGKMPPESEEEYIMTFLKYLAPEIKATELELATTQELKKRTDIMAELYKKIAQTDDEAIKNEARKDLNRLISRNYLNRGLAMKSALKELSNYRLTDELIDQYKDDYDNFTWFVSFAPYEKPEIAVVVLIPQGGRGGNGAAIAKDIYGYYFNLAPNK